jgi:hypothetical protein
MRRKPCEGLEDEAAFPESRVRQLQAGLGAPHFPEKDQIQVERPRRSPARPGAAAIALDREQMLE